MSVSPRRTAQHGRRGFLVFEDLTPAQCHLRILLRILDPEPVPEPVPDEAKPLQLQGFRGVGPVGLEPTTKGL